MRLAFIIVLVLFLIAMIVYLYWGNLQKFKSQITERRKMKEIRKQAELDRAILMVNEWKKQQHDAWVKEFESTNRRKTGLDS